MRRPSLFAVTSPDQAFPCEELPNVNFTAVFGCFAECLKFCKVVQHWCSCSLTGLWDLVCASGASVICCWCSLRTNQRRKSSLTAVPLLQTFLRSLTQLLMLCVEESSRVVQACSHWLWVCFPHCKHCHKAVLCHSKASSPPGNNLSWETKLRLLATQHLSTL